MNNAYKALFAGMLSIVFSAPALFAHDVPNIEHSHAFRQTGYGQYRQGHSVNGPQGSIVIWSAQPWNGYKPGPAVRFPRPRPITRTPSPQVAKPASGMTPEIRDRKTDRQ